MKNYFTDFPSSRINAENYALLQELPQSLQTELSLIINQDLVRNVNIFNFGSPNFLLRTARLLYPKVSMQHDIVVRRGELADEFYFIKEGRVEILATDEKTVLG